MTDRIQARVDALEAEALRQSRELSNALQDLEALGVQLSRLERVGVELAAGEDRWRALDELLVEARRVLASTGFHDRREGSQFLCECSTCTKRDRAGPELEG